MDAQVIVEILSGSVAAAILTYTLTLLRERKPLIAYWSRYEAVPRPDAALPDVEVNCDGCRGQFGNIFRIDIFIESYTTLHFPTFPLTIQLAPTDYAIEVLTESSGGAHRVNIQNPVTPATPSQALDLSLVPLSARDSYTIRLYVVAGVGLKDPADVRVDTSAPVNFKFGGQLPETASRFRRRWGLVFVRKARKRTKSA